MSILLTVTLIIPSKYNLLNYVFSQGDNRFYIFDINDSSSKQHLITLEGKFIVGSTIFLLDNSLQIGVIEGIELENGGFDFSLQYSKLDELENFIKEPLQLPDEGFIRGLGYHKNGTELIFSAIISNGTTQGNSVTNIIQFDLSGEIIKIIEYDLPNYDDSKILDLCSLGNDEFLILNTQGKSEALNDVTSHATFFNARNNSYQPVELNTEGDSIAYDVETKQILTNSDQMIILSDINGKIKNQINTGISISEIDYFNSTHSLIREYINNLSFFIALGIIVLILTVVIILYITYKRLKKK